MSYRLSPRDMRAGTVVAEHYGAPLDQVALVLETSIANTRRIVRKWRECGLMAEIPVKPVPGMSWVYPTAKSAEELLGHPVRYWKPTPKNANHVLMVLRVRLAVVGNGVGNWVSERTLRYEVSVPNQRGVRRPHIHDGRYTTGAGELWAIEVELSEKNSADARDAVHRAYQTAQAAHCDGLIYYCGDQRIRDLINTSAQGLQTSLATKFRVALLSDVLPDTEATSDPAAESHQGLRLVVGGDDPRGISR
ncbi:hypothetical protein [Nocardia sp. NPDC004722]